MDCPRSAELDGARRRAAEEQRQASVSRAPGRAGAQPRARPGHDAQGPGRGRRRVRAPPGNLEYGIGNASILVLQQVATALQCSLPTCWGRGPAPPSGLLIRELLEHQDEATLRRVRVRSCRSSTRRARTPARGRPRIALIGLRGAGKSTLGQMLADDLGCPSWSSAARSRSSPAAASARSTPSTAQNAYRRYERRALEETSRSTARP